MVEEYLPGSFFKHIPKGGRIFKKNNDGTTILRPSAYHHTILDRENGVISDVKMIKAVGYWVFVVETFHVISHHR